MPTLYPTALDTTTNLPVTIADATTQATNHPAYHNTEDGALIAIETKIGIGASTPTNTRVLAGGVTPGTSSWQLVSTLATGVADSNAQLYGDMVWRQAWHGVRYSGARFGIVPDGTRTPEANSGVTSPGTDWTTAINNALITIETAGGGLLELDAGVYNHKGIVLRNRTGIVGRGRWATILKLMNNSNTHNIINHISTNGTTDANAKSTLLQDFGIEGNADAETGAVGTSHGIVYGTNPSFSGATADDSGDSEQVVFRVNIWHVRGTGMIATGMGEHHWCEVISHNAYGDGFQPTFDSALIRCIADNAGGTGFVLSSPSVRVTNCKAFTSGWLTPGTKGDGFLIGGGYGGLNLTDSQAQDNRGHGFNFNNSQRNVVTNCSAEGSGNRQANNGYTLYSRVGFNFENGSDFNILNGCQAFESRRYSGANQDPQQNAIAFDATSNGNVIQGLLHSAVNGNGLGLPTIGSYIKAGSVSIGNSFQMGRYAAVQTFGSVTGTQTPNPFVGETHLYTLGGNITIANPTTTELYYEGQLLTFVLTQDGTGGRTVTWGSEYKKLWTGITTTLNTITTITFMRTATGLWVQRGAVATGLA